MSTATASPAATTLVPNEQLRRHVTSTAFALTLSERMTRTVLRLYAWERHVKVHPWMDNEADFSGRSLERCVDPSRARPLESRGLLRRCSNSADRSDYTAEFELTRAGRLTAQLLIEAGFDLEVRFPSYPHPDDRPKLVVGDIELGDDAMLLEPDGDRRHEEPRGLG